MLITNLFSSIPFNYRLRYFTSLGLGDGGGNVVRALLISRRTSELITLALNCVSVGDAACVECAEVCDLCCFLMSSLTPNRTQLNFTVAIDFTASNGTSRTRSRCGWMTLSCMVGHFSESEVGESRTETPAHFRGFSRSIWSYYL